MTDASVTLVPSCWHGCDISMCHTCAKPAVTTVHCTNLNSVDIHTVLCLIRFDKKEYSVFINCLLVRSLSLKLVDNRLPLG